MIDIEQIKLRLESLNKRRPGHLTPDECSRLLPIFSDLIEEVELLRCELKILKEDYAIEKAVWERDKATLEAQRNKDQDHFVEELKKQDHEIADLARQLNCSKEIQTAEKKILIAEIEKRAMLEAQMCGTREPLIILAGLSDSKGFTHAAELHDTIKMSEFAKQALASTAKCGHEERIKELEALEGTCPTCGMQQVKVG